MTRSRLYHKILLTGFFLVFATQLIGQVAPPAAYPVNAKVNYVRTWEASAPEQNPAVLVTRPLKDVKQTTVYLDGLGRPIQTVVKQGSLTTGSSPVDLVSPNVYDAFGREEFKYLSFSANNTGGNTSVNDGQFKLNPFQQQAAFGNSQYPGESYYYSRTQYEASQLNRLEKSFAPGNNWVGSARSQEIKYWVNTTLDEVRIWTITEASGSLAGYQSSSTYLPGALYKNVSIDENQKQIIEFKDKENKIILRKVQLNSFIDDGYGSNHDNWMCTYYIYDDLGNLRCVIQPEGVEAIKADWILNDAVILAEQCFRYEYDELNRPTIKKFPGAGELLMVYDIRDRLVFTQDANMRSNHQWLAMLYDGLNRMVLKGTISYDGSREQLQTLVTLQTSGTSGASQPTPTDITLFLPTTSTAEYATNSIILDPGFETMSNEFTAEIINSASSNDQISTNIEGVAINRNPLPTGTSLDPLHIFYYDNYQWATALPVELKEFETGVANAHFQTPTMSFPYAQTVAKTTATTNIITGSKTRIINSSPAKYITQVNFFDEKSRLIQTRTLNFTSDIDVQSTQYSWSGSPLVMIQQQQKGAPNNQTHLIITRTTYDDLGRGMEVHKTISSNIGGIVYSKPETEIARHEYNAIGQLKKKVIGNGIEQLDFDYNIRGWMTGVNKDFIKDASNRFFGFELGYDKSNAIINGTSYNNPQFNGNISGSTWKSAGDHEERKFDYSYDQANRLTSAIFSQYTGSSFNQNSGLNFNVENLAYDRNGNIQSMKQYGWKINQTNAIIDDLTYTYFLKTNKLRNVIDAANDPDTKTGDFRSSRSYVDALSSPKSNAA